MGRQKMQEEEKKKKRRRKGKKENRTRAEKGSKKNKEKRKATSDEQRKSKRQKRTKFNENTCRVCGNVWEAETEEVEVWVNCQSCTGWYHASCVGVDEEEAEETDYICDLCNHED